MPAVDQVFFFLCLGIRCRWVPLFFVAYMHRVHRHHVHMPHVHMHMHMRMHMHMLMLMHMHMHMHMHISAHIST